MKVNIKLSDEMLGVLREINSRQRRDDDAVSKTMEAIRGLIHTDLPEPEECDIRLEEVEGG